MVLLPVLNSALVTRRGFLATLGGLSALSLTGCGSSQGTGQGTEPSGASGYPGSGLDGGLGAGGGAGGHAGIDSGIDAQGVDAHPSRFRLDADFARLPSHYSSDLAFYESRILGVATAGGPEIGDRNHLFTFDPAASVPIESYSELDLSGTAGRFLNGLVTRMGGQGIVTANDGFFEFGLGSPHSQRFLPFPTGTSYGGGALYAGGKLFMAAANLNGVDYDPGAILIYDVDGAGAVQEATLRRLTTSGLNPTGVALRGTSGLAVLSSGVFGAGAQAFLDLIDMTSETVARSIPLGGLTAQVSHEIALTPDGRTAVIGTADDSGRALFVDLDTGEVVTQTIEGTRFHSSVKIDSALGIVYVSDFNGGSVTVLDLATHAVLASVALASGEAGPSEIYGGALIQSLPYAAARIVPE
jgi:hypothetical protein